MKTFASALILSASILGASAHADGLPYPPASDNGPSLTRAQVVQQWQQAKASGLITTGEQDYPPVVNEGSTETHAQVRDELNAAKAQGLVTYGQEDYPPRRS